jgi:hypothetical protein
MDAIILRQETQLAVTIGKAKSIYIYTIEAVPRRQSIHVRDQSRDIQQISDGINP